MSNHAERLGSAVYRFTDACACSGGALSSWLRYGRGSPGRAPLPVADGVPPRRTRAERPPRLLAQVHEAIRLRHGSRSTGKSYVGWIRRYILFHGKRHPAEMGAPEVTRCSELAGGRGPGSRVNAKPGAQRAPVSLSSRAPSGPALA